MKNNYTLQAKHIGLTVVMLTLLISSSFAQLFTQNFSLGNPVSQYVSATPTNQQYTSVSTSGSASVSAASNALVFSRPGSGQGAFSRIQNFSPLPTSLLYSFTLSATSTAALNSVARWKVGQNFTNSITSEASSNTHSQLGLDYGSPSGQWRLRDIGTGATSAFFSGTQTITWAINNSGASISYFGPNGAAESVGNDKMDVWVGTTKVFDDKSVTTGSVNLEDLKFYISGGNGTVTMDNFLIDPITTALTCASAVTGTTDPDNCNGFVTVLPPIVNSVICNPVISIFNDFNGTSDASDYYPIGVTTINWTIVDNCGNTFTCSSTVTITDNDSPVFICLGNQTVLTNPNVCSYLATGGIFDPILTDNCTIDENTWLISGATIGSGTTSVDGTVFNHGTTNVTWTAIDVSGNSAACSFDVIVNDGQNPVITCPASISVNNIPTACNATVTSLGTPLTSDNCGVASVSNDHPLTTYTVGTTIVTWMVIDASGNSSTCQQIVTVIDNENPTITCPADVAVNNGAGNCSAVVALGSPLTSDNCGVASTTNNHASAIYPVGTTVVIWTVTDVHGNSATCSQNVVVTDNENPTITCPANVAVNNGAGNCSAVVALGSP
ncbi:MAG: HYR domain-containing protein, partial [Chitinophagales bacterium]|nr:HYR domain-containing protein [Chitinophagales bacterium]